jgi:hypothetical protein
VSRHHTKPRVRHEVNVNALRMDEKRAILLAAQRRLDPRLDSLRDHGVDLLVQQNLLLVDAQAPVTAEELQARGRFAFGGVPSLNLDQIEESVGRLKRSGAVVITETEPHLRFTLSAKARREMEHAEADSERRLRAVSNSIFGPEAPSYTPAFLEALCHIFAGVGEAYIEHLQGGSPLEGASGLRILRSSVKRSAKSHPGVHAERLQAGLVKFFDRKDAESDLLKWNLCQSYLLIKTLGLDPEGLLLSSEMFARSVFYLDTNVVIDAVDPRRRHHKGFRLLAKACESLNITLAVADITLAELDSMITEQEERIKKLARKGDATSLPQRASEAF